MSQVLQTSHFVFFAIPYNFKHNCEDHFFTLNVIIVIHICYFEMQTTYNAEKIQLFRVQLDSKSFP